MVKIFRIEFKLFPLDECTQEPLFEKGISIGPYCYVDQSLYGFQQLRLGLLLQDPILHPMPLADGIPRYPKTVERFGFININQVLSWFGEYLQPLHYAGYHLVQYEVPEQFILHGNKQVMFNTDEAEIINFQSLMPLYYKFKAQKHKEKDKKVLAQ